MAVREPTTDGAAGSPQPGFEQACEVLATGGVIAYPTETYYGLGVRADLPDAVARLAAIKERDAQLPVIADCIETALQWADIGPALQPLLLQLWPGALTVVAPPRLDVPAPLLSPRRTLAIRVCANALATALARRSGGVITSTSANLRGQVPAAAAAARLEDWEVVKNRAARIS